MSISLKAIPKCSCGTDLIPFEDVSQNGQVYLKGWACVHCQTQHIIRSGDVYKSSVVDDNRKR